MLTELVLKTPGFDKLDVPKEIPTGGIKTGSNIIATFIGVAFVVAIIVCLFFIIWGAINWITSSGDKQKLASARNRIMYAIIGLLLVLFSVLIANLFIGFLGLPTISR